MTAQTPRNQTVILRPSVIGRSINTYTAFEEEALVKIAAYDGLATTGSAFLGLWNCRANPIAEIIPLTDFMGVQPGRDYVMQAHRSGKCSRMNWQKKTDVPVFAADVAGHEWELFTLRALEERVELGPSRSFTLSNLGLLGKMTGAVAIVRQDLQVHEAGPLEAKEKPFSPFSSRIAEAPKARLRLSVILKTLGVLGIWIEELHTVDLGRNTFVLLQGSPVPFHCVGRSERDERVLEIDVERAWNEMQLVGGFDNEVGVELFLS